MAPAVIVVGAGGNLGPSIVRALLAHKGDFRRVGILAAPEKKGKFADVEAQGVELVLGDYKDSKPYNGFDVVISLAGNDIMKFQPQMIDAAIAAGVRHFYPSEFGVDISQTPFLSERYFRDKHVTRDHLRAKAKEVPELCFTYVIIGVFGETFALSPVFGVDREKKEFTFYGDPESERSFSSMADAARYTVESILIPLPPSKQERSLRVPNGNWKVKDAIKILGEVQGLQYTCNIKPLNEARELQEKSRQSGDTGEELAFSLKALFGTPYATVPEPWDNSKFSFTPMTLQEMLMSFFEK
ncbi:NmrA-like family-domain-containing protein [Lipomyces starkeyi]